MEAANTSPQLCCQVTLRVGTSEGDLTLLFRAHGSRPPAQGPGIWLDTGPLPEPQISSLFGLLWLWSQRTHGKHSNSRLQPEPATCHPRPALPLTQDSNLQGTHVYYSFSTQNDSLQREMQLPERPTAQHSGAKGLLICPNYAPLWLINRL